MDLAAIIAMCLSTFTAGILLVWHRQFSSAEAKLLNLVIEFDKVTKVASESNLSLAEKLVHLEIRLDNVDAWRSMTGASQGMQSGWKN